MHAGLLRPDSEPSSALAEVHQLAQELKQHPDFTTKPAPVALVFDYESDWAWTTQPQGKTFSYFRLVFEHYRALRRLGLSIDICPPSTTDFSAYSLVLVPGLMAWTQSLKAALQTTKGLVVLGARTGSKTRDFQIPNCLAPACPELIKLKIVQVESLPPSYTEELLQGGLIKNWREYLSLPQDTSILLSNLKHEPIAVRQNKVIYCGAWLDLEGYLQLLEPLCHELGLTTIRLPDGLRLRQLGQGVVAFNYASETYDLSLLTGFSFDKTEVKAADLAFGRILK